MKRQLALALALIFALLTLTACGQTAEETPTRTPTPEEELEDMTMGEIMNGLMDGTIYVTEDVQETEEPDYSDRTILTIGQYGGGYPFIASQFNVSQEEYAVEVIDYSQGGTITRENAIIRLNADLATGKGPDIIAFDNFEVTPVEYGKKGYLADLYSFLDTDPELGREDLLESVLSSFEINGALYWTVTSACPMTILSSRSVADSLTSWTFQDMMQLIREKDPGTPVFMENEDSRRMLSWLSITLVNEFVDFDSYTAYFDTDGFKSFLEICNSLSPIEREDEDEIIKPLMSIEPFCSFVEIQYYNWLYDNDPVILGFPSSGGTGVSYLITEFDAYGINAASGHKDAAWQCVKYILSDEYHGMMYFPINRNNLQTRIDDEKKVKYKFDANFEETDEIDTDLGSVQGFPYHPATDEDVEQVMSILNSATAPGLRERTISAMIVEEAEYYFSGSKTVDEVASLLQSRVSLYLGEQK